MKKSELRKYIRESILKEFETAPAQPVTKPTIKPGEKTRRRTLTPPKHAPQTTPKAEGQEMDIADKIGDRFKKLKNDKMVMERMKKLAGLDYDKNIDSSSIYEIKVSLSRSPSKEEAKQLGDLFDGYGDGTSGFELHEPYSEERNIDDFDDEYEDERKQIMVDLLEGGKRTLLGNNIFGYNEFPPGFNESGVFTEKTVIDPGNGNIILYTPWISNDGYNGGYFNNNGRYVPLTDFIDEEGNTIQ